MYRRVLTELEELARERGQLADPLVRDRLVDLEIRVRIIRYNAQRTIADILATGEAGAASSVSRLLITAFEQDIHEFAVDMLGPAGLLGKTAPQAVQRSRWLLGFLRTRASTIGAGTREIQLNTVAEQVLGLPHDPGMPAALTGPTRRRRCALTTAPNWRTTGPRSGPSSPGTGRARAST